MLESALEQANFYQIAKSWSENFGISNLIVRNYDNIENVVEDFLLLIGINEKLPANYSESRQNVSLAAETLEFKRLVNARGGHDRALTAALKRIQATEGWKKRARILSRSQVEAVIAAVEEGNTKLWREFLPPGAPFFCFPEPALRDVLADPMERETLLRIAVGLWADGRKTGSKAAKNMEIGRRRRGYWPISPLTSMFRK